MEKPMYQKKFQKKQKPKINFNKAISEMNPEIKKKWENEQNTIKSQFSEVNHIPEHIKYIAGMDITFSKRFENLAIASIVILDSDLNQIFIKNKVRVIEVPYIPSFLAFREIDPMIELFQETVEQLEKDIPDFRIDCVFVDGNGRLHPRECGLATHLGVLIDTPTIGCAKTLFSIDGINRYNVLNDLKNEFRNLGNVITHRMLKGNSGKIWGAAVKNTKDSYVPLIVSQGHKVSIEKAVELVIKYSLIRVVEPVRVADKESRRLMNKFEKFINSKKIEKLEDAVSQFKV